ncbi:MAG: hypothetical protein HOM21_09665 [Halobacteriovoraceae bacterium]|jgi:hypothetical protein|nr:hypothetical protein [Halobacteriovoraceae bacterium]
MNSFEVTQNFRDDFRKTEVPKYYLGRLHCLFNFGLLISTIIGLAYLIVSPTLFELGMIPLTLVLGNFAVFIIHKFPLHQRSGLFPYPYKVHSNWHHNFYTYDHLIYDGPKDFFILFFPAWVVLAFVTLFLPAIFFGLRGILGLNATYLLMLMSAFYFVLYETVHFTCHLPEKHLVLKFPPLKFMWKFHRIHHHPKHMHSHNFGIVYPLCDYLFGTVYKESSVEKI